MSKLLKIVLLLGAAMFGLVVLLGVGGYFLFQSHEDDLASVAQTAKVDAERFAEGRVPSDCVAESLERLRGCKGASHRL